MKDALGEVVDDCLGLVRTLSLRNPDGVCDDKNDRCWNSTAKHYRTASPDKHA